MAPSGSKKRKGSKKKKKLGPKKNNYNGEEDLGHVDDRENDGSVVSSPGTQDHQNHQEQFTEGEEVGERQLEISRDGLFNVDENKLNGVKNEGKEVNVVAVEEGGTVHVERELRIEDESVSHNVNIECVEPAVLQRSSSSSSEEKSNITDEKHVLVGNAPAVESVKETAFTSDLNKAAKLEEAVQVATGASDTGIVTLEPIESSEKENEDIKYGVMDEETGASEVLVDTVLEKQDNEASPALHDDAVATSDVKPSAALQNEEKLELSYDAPADANVLADEMKGSPREHQPLVALAPRPVQTTSWKSCCGLFEVFAGSNR